MSRVSTSSQRLLDRSLPATAPDLNPVADELPGWLLQTPGIGPLAAQLGVTEVRRRLLHMLPGFLPCLLWTAPHEDPWGPLLLNITLVISVVAIAFSLLRASLFARPGETQWAEAVFGYGLPVLGMLFLLPGRAELGLMTLTILALGDGSAALGGIAWGRRCLPWNRQKTWVGMFCFVIASTSMASLYYWMEALPKVSFAVALAITGTAAVAASIVESLPLRSHDNLRVGVTAALTGLLMHVMLLGW